MKPIFIINRFSETVAKKGSRLLPLASHAAAVFDHSIFDKLDEIIREGHKSGWVIIEGGDGTVQGIMSAFFNQTQDPNLLPKFTLLPGGMTNQVCKNIGFHSLKRRRLQELLIKPTKSVKTSLLKVSSEESASLYGFLFSTGGVPMLTQYTKETLHSKGIGGSVAVVGGIIKGLMSKDKTVLSPSDISVKADNNYHSGAHLGTLVTTLPSLILGLDPFWGSGDAPLRLTYVEGSAKNLPLNAAGLWMKRKTKSRTKDGLHSYRTVRIEYKYCGPVVLDGELLSIGSDFTISATEPVTFLT